MFNTPISDSDRVFFRGTECRINSIMTDESRDFATLVQGPYHEKRSCDLRSSVLWGDMIKIAPSKIAQTSRVVATYNDGTQLFEHILTDL